MSGRLRHVGELLAEAVPALAWPRLGSVEARLQPPPLDVGEPPTWRACPGCAAPIAFPVGYSVLCQTCRWWLTLDPQREWRPSQRSLLERLASAARFREVA